MIRFPEMRSVADWTEMFVTRRFSLASLQSGGHLLYCRVRAWLHSSTG
jgi:hypothetical protein